MSDEQIKRIRSGLQCAMSYARGTGTDYDKFTADAWVALFAILFAGLFFIGVM